MQKFCFQKYQCKRNLGVKKGKKPSTLGSIDANILHHVALLFTDFTEIRSKTLTSKKL